MNTPFGEFEPPIEHRPQLDSNILRALQWCEHILQDFHDSGRPINVHLQHGEPSIVCQVNGHRIELLVFEAARSMYGERHTRFPPHSVPMMLDGVDWPWIMFGGGSPAQTLDAIASLLLMLGSGAHAHLPEILLRVLDLDEGSEYRR